MKWNAGLKIARAHKVQEDYIYGQTWRSRDRKLFPQKYQGVNHKIFVVTELYLLLSSPKEKTVRADEEGGRQ